MILRKRMLTIMNSTQVKGLDLKKCNLTGYKLDKIAVPGLGNVSSFTVTGDIPKENPIKVYYIQEHLL